MGFREATRFKLPQHFPVIFEAENPQSGRPFQMDNISLTGVGLSIQSRAKDELPEIGEQIQGRLRYGDKVCQTTIKIVHHTDKVMGALFTCSQQEVEQFITDDIMRDLFPSLKD